MVSWLQKSRWLLLSGLSVLAACGQGGAPSSVISTGSALDEAGVFGGERIESRMMISRYVVGIEYEGADGKPKICTGALVGPQIVLTAAHCVSKKLSSMRVVFATSLEDIDSVSSSLKRRVVAARVHENYQKAEDERVFTNVYDLAVLKLDSAAPSSARHAQLAASTFSVSQIPTVYVIGYGMTTMNSRTRVATGERTLKSAIVTRRESELPETLSLDQSKGTGVCVGDSGGPMLVENAEGFITMGIASTVYNPKGDDLCTDQATYINVAHYRSWIHQQAFELLQTYR